MAKEAEFAETFLKTSTNWSEYWVNDRIYPRRRTFTQEEVFGGIQPKQAEFGSIIGSPAHIFP